MNASTLRNLTDEGLALYAEIATREKRLKEIEKTLKAYAESKPDLHVKLVDEDREGTRLLITGTDNRIVPVVFTSDLIKQTIADGSDDLTEIRELAETRTGNFFREFYSRTVTFEATHLKAGKFDGKKFREMARQLLDKPEEFIGACVRKNRDGIPVSQAKVAWNESEEGAKA